MRNKLVAILALIYFCALNTQLSTVFGQGSGFTYQGRLDDSGSPPNGSYDFIFTVLDGGGSVAAGPLTNSPTLVTNGLFTVTLDFGSGAFTGADRWLEIAVRTNGGGAFATLTPRQQIGSAPYAVRAAVATAFTGAVADNQLAANVARLNSNAVFTGATIFSNSVGIAGKTTLQFGAGIAGQEANAGKIGYGTFTPGALDIVGAGTNGGSRSIKFWNEGGATFNGLVAAPGFNGAFTGNGGGLTNLNPTNLASGTASININGSAATAATAASFSGPLAGDVTGTQGATVVGTVGGQSAANVANGASAANAATSANAPDTIVKRDASGNFSAGSITANSFNGNGGGLTNLSGTMAWQVVSDTTLQAQPNTGYLLTNNSLVSVTLPASPEPGAIVRVTGAGAGGWKIAQNANQAIATANLAGNIGPAWTARETPRNWFSVAGSADGNKFVALNLGGFIYTSTDSGASWTSRDSSRSWHGVASSSDGVKLVAVVQNGQIYTSTNSGINWTAGESNRNWFSVASSADGVKLVAVVSGGQIYTSTNSGSTWAASESSRLWNYVASSADGTRLVAVVSSGQIYTSTDSGATWTPRDSGRNWGSVASSADGTKLVAVAYGGQIYTSTDSGVTWVPRDSSRNWVPVSSSADGTKLIAGVYGGQIYTSVDSGVNWTARDSNRAWESIASSADGTKVTAVTVGSIYTSVPTSVSSTTIGTAGYLLGGQNTAIELQYLGNNQFLPISYSGIIQAF